MLRALRSFIIVAATLAGIGHASAVTWYGPVSNYTPSGGPVAASASPGSAGGGWVDVSGNVWAINSSNQLVPAKTAGSPWNTGVLARPVGEATADARIQIKFTTTAAANGDIYAFARYNAGTGGASANGYIAGLGGGNTFIIGKIVGGTYTNLGSSAGGSIGVTTLTLQVDVVQTNATTTTITVSLLNSAGSVIGTYSATDTTAAFQTGGTYASGQQGVFQNIPTSPTNTFYNSLATYTDIIQPSKQVLLSGPSTGVTGQASTFTVSDDGTLASPVTITPSDGGAGGTFSPTSVTLAASSTTTSSATFTYSRPTDGTSSITLTNNGSLTNPAAFSYTSATPVPVNSPAFRFSPGNWKGDTGRGGSVYRQSWNNGAYFEFTWTASATPTAQILLPTSSTSNMLSYTINGVLIDNVAATGPITISSANITASASNTLRVYLRNSTQSSRWNNGTNVVKILGVQLDSGSTAGVAAQPANWALIVGDSLTEGIQANGGSDDSLYSWGYYVGQSLLARGDYDYALSACGYSGWLRPGDSGGDVPAYYSTPGGVYSDSASRWNKIDQGVSLLDANGFMSAQGALNTPPALIIINYITNESLSSSSQSDTTASITQALVALRAAAPSAKIFIVVPFGLYGTGAFPSGPTYASLLKAAVASYQSSHPADANVTVLDFGANFSSFIQSALFGGAIVHPTNPVSHANEAALVIPKIAASLVASFLQRTQGSSQGIN